MKIEKVLSVGLAAYTLVALFCVDDAAAQDQAYVARIVEEVRRLDPETGLSSDPFELTPEALLRSGRLTQLRQELLALRVCAQAGAESRGLVLSSSAAQKQLAQSWMDAAFDPEQGPVELLSDPRAWSEIRKMVLSWRFYCAATQTVAARLRSDVCYASCSLRLARCENHGATWEPPALGHHDYCDWAFTTCLFGCSSSL